MFIQTSDQVTSQNTQKCVYNIMHVAIVLNANWALWQDGMIENMQIDNMHIFLIFIESSTATFWILTLT